MQKKRILAALISAVLLLSLVSCGVDPDVPYGMVRASEEFCEYALFIPEEWVVNQTGAATAAYKSASDPTSVSVMSWTMPYADSTVSDWWNGYEESFSLTFTDFAVESEESVLLGGSPATKFVYTGALDGNVYRYTQYAAVKNSVLYLLTFTELAEADIDHSEDFSRILENFTWTK